VALDPDSIPSYGALHKKRLTTLSLVLTCLLAGWVIVHQLVVPDVARPSLMLLGGLLVPHSALVVVLCLRLRPSLREYVSLYGLTVAHVAVELVIASSASAAVPYLEAGTCYVLVVTANVVFRYRFRNALLFNILSLAITAPLLVRGGAGPATVFAWGVCAVAISLSTLYVNYLVARTETQYIRQERYLEMVLTGGMRTLIEIDPATAMLTSYTYDGRGARVPHAAGLAEYLDSIHEDRRAQVADGIGRCLAGSVDDFAVEYRTVRPGQTDWRHIRLSGRAERGAMGTVGKMIGTLCDITHLKQLHAQVEEQSAALELAARRKAGFLATMNHHVRTPLNALIGAASLLAAEPLADDLRRLVGTVEWSGQALIALLNDALDLDSFEKGTGRLRSVAFDPRVLVEQCVHQLRPLAWKKGLTVGCTVSPGLCVSVSGDPVRLQQVLMNLLSNAVKFSDHGWINVSAAAIESTDAAKQTIRFEVADTGRGIGEEARAFLFQPFEQAHRPAMAEPSGTGLGLSISQHLVELMGGRLSCESSCGEGSRFYFTVSFPVLDARSGGVQHVAEGVSGGKPPEMVRVLVAEDNPVNQRILRRMLERLNCQVRVVPDGEEAVAACGCARFDVVFMDCDMPVMGGIEATRAIRAIAGFADVPILAITAHTLLSNVEACLDAGMSEVLTKPVTLEQLKLALVRRTTGRRRDTVVAGGPVAPR
jgi:signal transduction histidine kinase/CheY-like chemotaxis protein